MIWLILVIALILRLVSLDQSLWLDEAINVVSAQKYDFLSFVTQYPLADFHPPGYFVLLWFWTRAFGTSEMIVRMPSVVFALGTIVVTYLLGRRLFSYQVGLVGALFLALAPLHIYYSQEARMYSFAAFAVALSIYFFIKLLNSEKYALFGYALSLTLVLYSDYVAYFILPVQFVYLLLYSKSQLKKMLFSLSLVGVLFLPWMSIFPKQFLNGQQTANELIGWKEVVGGASMKEGALLAVKTLIGRISFENKMFYGVFVGVIFLPYLIVILQTIRNIERSTKLLLCWLLIPPLLALGISFFIPVFAYFRFIFILPAFYLLVSVGIDKFKHSRYLFLGIIIFLEIIASGMYFFNAKFHREDWKGAVNFLNKRNTNQSIVLFESNDVFAPFVYYTNNLENAKGGLLKVPAVKDNDIIDLKQDSKDVKDVYLFEYLVDITDPKRLLEKQLQSAGFIKINVYDFKGVGFITRYENRF